MAAFVIKAVGRATLRRSPFPTRPANLTRGNHTRNHTKSPPTKADENAANGTSIPVANTVANVPIWHRLGPLSRGFQAYARSQRKHPLKTQFFSALVIFSLGDLSAQSINGDEYSPARTLRALVIGAGAAIPSYKWFMFLGNHFNYSSKVMSLATKVVVNQALFTPVNNTYFFGMQAFLSGDSMEQVLERIKRTVPTSVINSLKLWPAVTAFSFTFIDAQYRSIFAGVIAIGWQTYLSYLNRKAEVEEALESASESASESGGREEMRSERTQKLGV
ncbi:sym1 [Hyphodiscus hymeniophilus]|uniref:Sym1 n=1 Tax=Hyphodiscus hymeniophilus TaxID=353542 RepID=A0A9P6VK54_9HELO|nr:sym1 [Hyphodiscus hymeniophilus]